MHVALWALFAMVQGSALNVFAESSVTACAGLVANLSWDFTDAEFYGAMCKYEPAIGTWTTCITDFFEDDDFKGVAGITRLCLDNMNHRCRALDFFGAPFTEQQFVESVNNASKYLENGSMVEWNGRQPVRFDKDYRRALGRAWIVNLRNLDTSNATSMYLYAFLTIMSLFASIIHHFSSIIFRQKPLNQIRSLLTLPTLRHKHAQPLLKAPGGLIPTRLELCLILGFLAAHTMALLYKYEFDKDEAIEGLWMQRLRYIGYRTGLLAFAQCPLIIFFSGRNSMFEIITGLHYSTSIVLHKWISRLMTFDAFCHGIIFILRAHIGGYLGHARKSRFWVCGALTLYASIFLCLLAFGMLRHRWYEFFLVTHIFLAITFFFYAWQHVKSLGWYGWIYASVGLWVVEKMFRGIRILAFGGVIQARAKLCEPNIIRVTIPKPRRGWTTHPGEYVFLYFLFPSAWWQSHPFTFVDRGDSIIVVIKAKRGVTDTLLTKVKASGGLASIPVCVEGPYGDSAAVSGFDGKLFVCGGSGIPGPLSYMLNEYKPNMLLVIVARDLDIINAFKPEILALPEQLAQIYITKPGTVHNSINDSEWDGHKNVLRGRRPDIFALVHGYLDASESLAITCCGPPALVDMTRDIIARALRANPSKYMTYFEEYQTW